MRRAWRQTVSARMARHTRLRQVRANRNSLGSIAPPVSGSLAKAQFYCPPLVALNWVLTAPKALGSSGRWFNQIKELQ